MNHTGLGVRKTLAILCFAATFVVLILPTAANAATVTSFQNAKLTTGSLQGTTFGFSFSYDSAAVNGSGQEFISLTGFNFNLLGTPYTLADITQGGQAIFQDGVLQNITAAFLTIPPKTGPVFSIALGLAVPASSDTSIWHTNSGREPTKPLPTFLNLPARSVWR